SLLSCPTLRPSDVVPRVGWTGSRLDLSVQAECTHTRPPPTRSPVSSKWATGAAAICWAALAVKASRPAAARPAVEITVPAEIEHPSRSDRAWAVRAADRNWPRYR